MIIKSNKIGVYCSSPVTITRTVASEPVLSANDALNNILQELSCGRDVLIGDTHTEVSHHLLFTAAVQAAIAAKIDFSSVLELPAQLEEELENFTNDDGKSIGSILQKVIDIHSGNLIPEFDYSMQNITLPTLRTYRVPIIPIDLQPRSLKHEVQEEDEEVNIFMAGAMRRGKIKSSGLPVLGLVGARHATKGGISKHYGDVFCLHAGLNATIYDPTGANIYEPYDYDCIVKLPSRA